MADVTLPNWLASDGGRTGRNRGQLVLLSGLVLATIFVALVLILNSAIYTENLATRNDGVPTTDAIEYRENTRQGSGGGAGVDEGLPSGGFIDYDGDDRVVRYLHITENRVEVELD